MNSEVVKNFTLEIKKIEEKEIGEVFPKHMYSNVGIVKKNFLICKIRSFRD